MERLERIYEKGPGFLRDVFQYLFPGILFLSFMTLIYFATKKDLSILLKVDFICLFKRYSQISGFFIFIVILFLVCAYLVGVLFMELGELTNWYTKRNLHNKTYKKEMRIALHSPIILSYYVERYNLLFYLRRNVGISFFFLAILCAVSYFCLSKSFWLFLGGIVAFILFIVFTFLIARQAYKDFVERIDAALEILEQEENK